MFGTSRNAICNVGKLHISVVLCPDTLLIKQTMYSVNTVYYNNYYLEPFKIAL